MEAFISYIIKANVAIVVLYGFYRLLLQRDTFFQSKRILLLTVYLFSVLYPLFSFSFVFDFSQVYIGQSIERNFKAFTLPEMIVAPQTMDIQSLIISNVLIIIYFIGVVVILTWILLQLISIFIHISQSQTDQLLGLKVKISKYPTSPYSFFGRIILDATTKDKNDLQEILLHEETHVRQWHSIDVLFSQLMCALLWFNPFVWLLNREIRMNLEYLADHSVLNSGCDPEHYQFHILRLTSQKAAANLSNNFNFSPLKKRIQMMNKKKTPRIGFSKYILLIPVFCALLLVNCSQKKEGNETEALGKIKEEVPEMVAPKTEVDSEAKVDVGSNDENIYTHVEVMPVFPGGDKEMMSFLYNNVKYPVTAQDNGIQGTVVLRFIVRETGKIGEVEVLRSLDPACDKEAMRVIRMMPDWAPGKQGGKPVAVYYNLPIKFKLSNS